MHPSGQPEESDAIAIAAEVFGEATITCTRFTTGLRHWVYDVVLESGRNVVVRLSHPDHRDELAGGVRWHDELTWVGVPVAQVLAHDSAAAQPFMILERLPGTDLGNVFDDLSTTQLRGIAASVSQMQEQTRHLPRADGFGYALNYDSPLESSWFDVVNAAVERSARSIESVGVVEPSWAERVRTLLATNVALLTDVEPVAFLHDATTKNVIVANGHVTGLVDVDHMAFGDPLYAVALTRMSLISAGRPTEYVDFLGGAEIDPAGRARLDIYTAVFGLGFLAELGQQFNQATAAPIDGDHLGHLELVLGSLL